MRRQLWFVLLLPLTGLAADLPYQQAPADVSEVLNAPPPPLASASPRGNAVVFMQAASHPSIADVAQPMQRLAGIRIDEATNGLHVAPTYVSFILKRLPDGASVPLDLPEKANLGAPVWSPDGRQFVFTNLTSFGIQLWVASAETGALRQIGGVLVNGVHFGPEDPPVVWFGDSRSLLVRLIPAGRGSPPALPPIPKGPDAQESLGGGGPAPTYEDLLASRHDEDLFDYYATAQLAICDVASGVARPVGSPAIYSLSVPSPDQQHILVERIQHPFSYQLPATDFPAIIEVLSRTGAAEYRVAALPVADHVPLAGVREGPRSVQWLQAKPATLVWAEALDKGDPKSKAPFRDHLLTLAAPFAAAPLEGFKTSRRFRSLAPLADGRVIVDDFERLKRIVHLTLVDLDHSATAPRELSRRNERDAYSDPGAFVIATESDGRQVVAQSGNAILLHGLGASPAGDRPFVDRLDLATGAKERVFQSGADGFEDVVAVLDDSGNGLITRRESPTEAPNFALRLGSQVSSLLIPASPPAALFHIRTQLVTYRRADGVPLSFRLYLPPGIPPGVRLPGLMWAYPYEFSDASTAGQVTGHAERSFPDLNYHQLAVLHGYALIDNAAMPIIGDPDTVNNTYVDQLLMDAKAAVDKAVEMGVVDRARIGVFGHSYGAFMTMNLLAHSDLFHAAVAESGAYNRTLTPFGFQSERRSFWEAPDVYTKMSPFWFADKIKTPILLTHGEADDNTGTYPIQSERMYAAIRGNGGIVRLVMLPAEAHAYRAKETLEHVVAEELGWFDRFLGKPDGYPPGMLNP
jgi:dipeptidyl aminopeptidase/acylaminoacyl peptidase